MKDGTTSTVTVDLQLPDVKKTKTTKWKPFEDLKFRCQYCNRMNS